MISNVLPAQAFVITVGCPVICRRASTYRPGVLPMAMRGAYARYQGVMPMDMRGAPGKAAFSAGE